MKLAACLIAAAHCSVVIISRGECSVKFSSLPKISEKEKFAEDIAKVLYFACVSKASTSNLKAGARDPTIDIERTLGITKVRCNEATELTYPTDSKIYATQTNSICGPLQTRYEYLQDALNTERIMPLHEPTLEECGAALDNAREVGIEIDGEKFSMPTQDGAIDLDNGPIGQVGDHLPDKSDNLINGDSVAPVESGTMQDAMSLQDAMSPPVRLYGEDDLVDIVAAEPPAAEESIETPDAVSPVAFDYKKNLSADPPAAEGSIGTPDGVNDNSNVVTIPDPKVAQVEPNSPVTPKHVDEPVSTTDDLSPRSSEAQPSTPEEKTQDLNGDSAAIEASGSQQTSISPLDYDRANLSAIPPDIAAPAQLETAPSKRGQAWKFVKDAWKGAKKGFSSRFLRGGNGTSSPPPPVNPGT